MTDEHHELVPEIKASLYKALGMVQRSEANPPANGWESLEQFMSQLIKKEDNNGSSNDL